MNVIEIENLWKEYRLGRIGHGTLTHDLQSWWARIKGNDDPNRKIVLNPTNKHRQIEGNHFWALSDINTQVQEGEVLGIIGHNGAGKSTLLKILSRVTAPSKGTIKIKGRIASLLEVGTGFHPELTGRENIFMNGAILGMSKFEIKKKLDEIVSFSGIETFIDTPVKRYSSGMYVRLAFAVAAHLEPEILVVDEVLAVGDAEFQKKCIGKMDKYADSGRTVIFVSHNLNMLGKLCKKCIFLNQGVLDSQGETSNIIRKYLNIKKSLSKTLLCERNDRRGNGFVTLQSIKILGRTRDESLVITTGEDVKLEINFKVNVKGSYKCRFSISIEKDEVPMILLDSYVVSGLYLNISDDGKIIFNLDRIPLSRGRYEVSLFVSSESEVFDWVRNVIDLEVEDGDFYGSGRLYPDGWDGKTVLVNYSIDNIIGGTLPSFSQSEPACAKDIHQ
jgi:lipopolysaccharide transport system ATP-binding protein